MSQVNQNPDPQARPPVRQTEVKTWLTYETMSPLGRELMDLAAEIDNSDEPALDEAEVERELALRRGGYNKDGV